MKRIPFKNDMNHYNHNLNSNYNRKKLNFDLLKLKLDFTH